MIRKAINLLPIKAIITINIIMGLIFVVDLIATIITLMGLSEKFKLIEDQSKDIRKVSDGIGQKVADRTFEALDRKKEIENSKIGKEFDQRSAEFKEFFDKFGEKRILRAFPNLSEDLEEKWARIDIIKKKKHK